MATKKKGGLGIGSLRAQNLALLSSWWWRFKKEDSPLWKKVICALHGKDGGFSNSKGKFPGVWRNVLKIQSDFQNLNLPLEAWFQQEETEGARAGDVRWTLSSSGIFSVSSVRYAIDDLSLVPGDHKEFVWSNWVPSRVNVLAWRVFHGRLPTKSNLEKRGLPLVSTSCPLCSNEVEDEKHLFIECNISRKVLLDICSWWGTNLNGIESVDHLLN